MSLSSSLSSDSCVSHGSTSSSETFICLFFSVVGGFLLLLWRSFGPCSFIFGFLSSKGIFSLGDQVYLFNLGSVRSYNCLRSSGWKLFRLGNVLFDRCNFCSFMWRFSRSCKLYCFVIGFGVYVRRHSWLWFVAFMRDFHRITTECASNRLLTFGFGMANYVNLLQSEILVTIEMAWKVASQAQGRPASHGYKNLPWQSVKSPLNEVGNCAHIVLFKGEYAYTNSNSFKTWFVRLFVERR